MALTNDTVLLFLLLMPGFLSSIILNMLIVRKPPSGLLLVIEALVFSFVIYACWGVLSGQFFVTVGASEAISPGAVSRKSLAGVMILSVVFPLGLGALLTHNYLFRVLEKLGVTRRTGRASMWLDVFIEHRRYVIVQFMDGRRLYGWPELYSDDVAEGMLYLYDPWWIDEDNSYTQIKVRGLLLLNRGIIESITFTHQTRDEAMIHADDKPVPNKTSFSSTDTIQSLHEWPESSSHSTGEAPSGSLSSAKETVSQKRVP